MKEVELSLLSQYPEFIRTVAQWHQDEWSHISPHLTTELRIREYSTYKSGMHIPSCTIAILDGLPVGSASLVQSDMQSHAHLGPWLASVYVRREFRGQGIASQLIQRQIDIVSQLAIQTIYLFTPDQTEFYKKRGWQLLTNYVYHNEHVDILFYDLT